MKRPSLVAASAACVVFLAAGLFAARRNRNSNRPPPAAGLQPGPANIAFIDVNKVFKNHTRFNMMMTEMKAELDNAEASIKHERDSIKSLMQKLEGFKPGSPEYKQLEEETARRQSELAVSVQLQKKNFLQQEAHNYYTVYTEMMQEVEYFAANNGVAMVMRFNGDPVDMQKPDDVLREINKPVLWFPAGCDITGFIIERLNRAKMNADQRGARPCRWAPIRRRTPTALMSAAAAGAGGPGWSRGRPTRFFWPFHG